MDLSETILAAMIGAAATVGTALFQILTAFKAKGRTDVKPKRGTAMRSLFAVTALMVASAAGGFLYSQFLQERAGEDIRAMRQELRELRDLTAERVLERSAPTQLADTSAPESTIQLPHESLADPVMSVSLEPENGVAESIAYVPACRAVAMAEAGAECQEAGAQRIALCGTVPTHSRVSSIQFFAQPDAVQHPWEQHAVALEADIGGARFSGKTFEYAQGPSAKAVCVNFLQWSSQHPHIARIVVQYSTGAEQESPKPEQMTPVVQTTVADGDVLQGGSPAAAFTGQATALR